MFTVIAHAIKKSAGMIIDAIIIAVNIIILLPITLLLSIIILPVMSTSHCFCFRPNCAYSV